MENDPKLAAKLGFALTTGLGWFIGDVGLLANWFILSDGAALGLVSNRLSKSIFTLPELAQVEPTGCGLFEAEVPDDVTLLLEGCKGAIGDGVSSEPGNC